VVRVRSRSQSTELRKKPLFAVFCSVLAAPISRALDKYDDPTNHACGLVVEANFAIQLRAHWLLRSNSFSNRRFQVNCMERNVVTFVSILTAFNILETIWWISHPVVLKKTTSFDLQSRLAGPPWVKKA
jgi:hypothetical protein